LGAENRATNQKLALCSLPRRLQAGHAGKAWTMAGFVANASWDDIFAMGTARGRVPAIAG